MTVTLQPFESKSGFKSPGFLVDANGNFTIANLNTSSAYKINGVAVLSSTALGANVLSSNLTSLGTLTNLSVNSTSDVNIDTSAGLNLNATSLSLASTTLTINTVGAIVLASGTTGSIDNVDIGTTTPGTGTFVNLTATENIYIGNQNIKAFTAAFAIALQ